MLCAPSITDGFRGHQCMQYENRWRAPTMFCRKKICARDVVGWEFGLDRAAPSDSRTSVSQYFRKMIVVRRRIVLMGGDSLVLLYITFHFRTAVAV